MSKRERETTSSTSDSHVLSRRDFVARTSLIGGRRAVVVDRVKRTRRVDAGPQIDSVFFEFEEAAEAYAQGSLMQLVEWAE
jgi:hypothetical protein